MKIADLQTRILPRQGFYTRLIATPTVGTSQAEYLVGRRDAIPGAALWEHFLRHFIFDEVQVTHGQELSVRCHASLYTGVAAAIFVLQSSSAGADPDCAGPNHWAAAMTYAQLKTLDVLPQGLIYFDHASSNLIASQKIGPDL